MVDPIMVMKADMNYTDGQTVSADLVNRFRASADAFVGLHNRSFLEIISFQDGSPSVVREEKIPMDQVKSWLDLESPVGSQAVGHAQSTALRLMLSPFNDDSTDYLPISSTVLASTLKFFGLQDSYLYDEKLQGLSNWFKIPLRDNLIGFIVKTEVFDSICASFSLILIADLLSGRKSGILHVLRKPDLQRIKDCLKQDPEQYSHNMMALPALIVQLRTSNMPAKLEEVRMQLYETEKRIGSHKNYQRKETHTRWGYYARGEEVWKREGFDAASGELTSMASDCMMFESVAQLYAKLLDWIEEMDRKLTITSSNQARSAPLLGEKLWVLKGLLEQCRIRSDYLGRRAGIQVQACASIMSQRDNANSLNASKVALRDSSDMRAISLVTMLFLPGTFMATLFSTGFFSFQQDGRVVSHWIWLYWVFTVGLTVLALVLFAIWNWHTSRKQVREAAITY